MNKRNIIVAITGASGAVYGVTLLKTLQDIDTVATHLVVSKTAKSVLEYEIGKGAYDSAVSMAQKIYEEDDLAAPIASGSYIAEGMIIAPCSAKTLSSIAHAYADNLIARAADVTLKERRRLVLLFRETPLHLAHIENMAKATQMGGIILPPVPAFYNKPGSIEEIICHSIGKTLDIFGIEHNLYRRWHGIAGT